MRIIVKLNVLVDDIMLGLMRAVKAAGRSCIDYEGLSAVNMMDDHIIVMNAYVDCRNDCDHCLAAIVAHYKRSYLDCLHQTSGGLIFPYCPWCIKELSPHHSRVLRYYDEARVCDGCRPAVNYYGATMAYKIWLIGDLVVLDIARHVCCLLIRVA